MEARAADLPYHPVRYALPGTPECPARIHAVDSPRCHLLLGPGTRRCPCTRVLGATRVCLCAVWFKM